LNAGVVDQNVDRAELRRGRGYQVGDFLRLGHVGPVVADRDVVARREIGPGGLDLGRVAEAVQHDVHARAGHCFGDAEADAAGRSGDDRVLALRHGTLIPSARGTIPGLALKARLSGPGARAQGGSPIP
jgi:hypothetical protein